MREWTNKNMKMIKSQSNKNFDINAKIKWIYGIRVGDINKPLLFIKNPGEKAASEKYIYIQDSIIIIFYPKLN